MASGSITSLVARTRRILRRRFNREVGQHSSLHPDLLRALYVLAEEQQIETQGNLAERLDLDPPAASRLVASLVSGGLVERETGEDRRCRILRITASGQRALIPVRAALHKVDLDLERILGSRPAESLRRMLIRILQDCESEARASKSDVTGISDPSAD
jgi:MarR family transcriptional regulator for hemolysin